MVVASIQVEWCSVRLSRNTSGYEITQINYFYLSPFFTLLSYLMKKLKWDFVTHYRWRLRKRIGQLDNWRTSRNGYVWVNEMIVRYNSMHYYTFFSLPALIFVGIVQKFRLTLNGWKKEVTRPTPKITQWFSPTMSLWRVETWKRYFSGLSTMKLYF